jgi:hypothetical protein
MQIGMGMNEFLAKYPNPIDSSYPLYDNASHDRRGKIYKVKLSNLEKDLLNDEITPMLGALLPYSNKMIYNKDDSNYIYDLKDKSSSVYFKRNTTLENDGNGISRWSQDGNYLMIYNNGDIDLYNVKDKSTKKLKVKSDGLFISTCSSLYSDDGNYVYFIGQESKNKYDKFSEIRRTGLFKIDTNTGKIEETLTFPYLKVGTEEYESYRINDSYSVFDNGKKILFSGDINNTAGVYIYDTDFKKFYTVVMAKKPKTDRGSNHIYISPDKTKIAYLDLSDENKTNHWDLYVAKIDGNNLTSKICVSKDIQIEGDIQWSGDSKKLLYFNQSDNIDKNGFFFNEKNELNVVTLS